MPSVESAMESRRKTSVWAVVGDNESRDILILTLSKKANMLDGVHISTKLPRSQAFTRCQKKKFRHGQTTLKRLLSLSHIPLPNSCQWWAVTKTFMGIFIHYWTEKNKHSRMAQERELWQPAPPWWGFLTSTQISPPGIHNLLGPRKDQDIGCSIQKGSMAQQKDKSRCTHPGHGFAAQLGKVLIFL